MLHLRERRWGQKVLHCCIRSPSRGEEVLPEMEFCFVLILSYATAYGLSKLSPTLQPVFTSLFILPASPALLFPPQHTIARSSAPVTTDWWNMLSNLLYALKNPSLLQHSLLCLLFCRAPMLSVQPRIVLNLTVKGSEASGTLCCRGKSYIISRLFGSLSFNGKYSRVSLGHEWNIGLEDYLLRSSVLSKNNKGNWSRWSVK